MLRDPIETTLWLRKRALEEVRRNLASQMAAAAAATAALREAERSVEEETRRVCEDETGDALVEAFAAWLPGARHRVAQARTALERQEAEITCIRAELAACRAGLEAIETLMTRRRLAESQRQERQVQFALDDAAARGATW